MRERLAPGSLQRARRLRRDTTVAERKLWRKLRELNHRAGYNFRRQAPFDPYTLDFVEHGARIVIELDGDQHGLSEQRAHDEQRDKMLSGRGYKVLRFWNRELNDQMDAVVNTIVQALAARRPPPENARAFSTSPQGGGAE